MKRYLLCTLFVLLLSAALVHAQQQENTCPTEVDIILSSVEQDCAALERNSACYGNYRIDAETAGDDVFAQSGDIVALEALFSLRTYPLSVEAAEWGIAVFSIQADLPDTLPGQNVTMVVFGEAEIEPDMDAPEDYSGPMQAFYFRTGIGAPVCQDVPEGGVLVQTPQQAPVQLLVNGFELRIGSTALLTAATTEELTITTLEGLVQVTAEGVTQDVPAGFTLMVQQAAPPELPAPDPEAAVLLDALLPEALPRVGHPGGETHRLLLCANSGGITVQAGQNIVLAGGWFDLDLAGVITFAATTPPTLDYNGQNLPYSYRAGPFPHISPELGEGYAIDWLWLVESITHGTHLATWFIGGHELVCEIRAE